MIYPDYPAKGWEQPPVWTTIKLKENNMTQKEERELSKELAEAIAMAGDILKLSRIIKGKIEPFPEEEKKASPPSSNCLFGLATNLHIALKESINYLEWTNRQL